MIIIGFSFAAYRLYDCKSNISNLEIGCCTVLRKHGYDILLAACVFSYFASRNYATCNNLSDMDFIIFSSVTNKTCLSKPQNVYVN